jgi:hypothetical protein
MTSSFRWGLQDGFPESSAASFHNVLLAAPPVACRVSSGELPIPQPDLSTPSGRLMFQIIGAMAEFERALILKLRVMESHAPFLTRRFDLAFHFAAGLHHKHVRKGTEIPYIAHLMSVCALVLEAGGNEDQAVAALLHDAMEDQGGLPTLNTIKRLFGDRVANIVRECSDSESPDPGQKLSWHQRKQAYLDHLRSASPDALLVAAADKLTTPGTSSHAIERWAMTCGGVSMRTQLRRTTCATTANW